ncbi:MAG: hypothetical protein H6923_10370 [Alphaproteobacteria bacterium]|nr:hypothetical protein [Alphaproteobacteria bacterium]
MAKAHFHKNQRVFVKPVGTWAQVERVLPQWTKGLNEPIRVYYDVGLGRDFSSEELEAEPNASYRPGEAEHWRLLRLQNKWQRREDCGHHPHPGTFPVIVTGERDWGGWRVPGAEYDLDPYRIEAQARLLTASPALRAIAERLVRTAATFAKLPPEFEPIVREARDTLARIGGPGPDGEATAAFEDEEEAPPPPPFAAEA